MAILSSSSPLPSFIYVCTQSLLPNISPRGSPEYCTLLVTQSLMVLSPSKRLSFHPQSNSGYGNGNICSVSSTSSLVSIQKVTYEAARKYQVVRYMPKQFDNGPIHLVLLDIILYNIKHNLLRSKKAPQPEFKKKPNDLTLITSPKNSDEL